MRPRHWLPLSGLLLGSCASMNAGSVANNLATPFVETDEAKLASQQQVTSQSRSSAMGVVMNLGGSEDSVRSQLGVGVVVFGSVPSPETRRYVEAIRDRLLAKWPYRLMAPTPRVEVTCNSGYGAESLADNTIQLPIGVIEKAETEDEIAFVIGHELGHLLLQHQAVREAQLNRSDSILKTATALGVTAADYALGKNGQKVAEGSDAAKHVAIGSAGGQMAGAEVLTTLIDPGWSRRQEEQADLVGTDLMTRAGYNPQYAAQAFENLLSGEQAAKQQADAASAASDSSAPDFDKNGMTLSALVKKALSPIGRGLRSLRVNHPDTSSRDNTLASYRDKFYASDETRESATSNLERLRNSAEFRRVLAAIADLRDADEALTSDPQRAAAKATEAEQKLPGWWAPSYVAGIASLQAGQTRDGIKQLVQATDESDTPYLVFERTAFEIADTGNTSGGIHILDKAALRFGGPDVTWLDRIALYRKAKNTAGVKMVQAQCSKSPNISIREECSKTTISSQFES